MRIRPLRNRCSGLRTATDLVSVVGTAESRRGIASSGDRSGSVTLESGSSFDPGAVAPDGVPVHLRHVTP